MKVMQMATILLVLLAIGSVSATTRCPIWNAALKTCISNGYQPVNKFLSPIFLENCDVQLNAAKKLRNKYVRKCRALESKTLKICGTGCGLVGERKCPGNMVYDDCASPCHPSCANPEPDCKAPCRPGCKCPNEAPILLTSAITGKLECISAEQCPECEGGMVPTSCASTCPRTCETPNKRCRAECEIGCTCPRAKPILHEGQCISPKKCPGSDKKICPGDLVFSKSALACPRTCAIPKPMCSKQRVRRCSCPSNAPIFHNRRCIPLEECPDKKCPGDFVLYDCPSTCQPTCARPNPQCDPPAICVRRCACPTAAPIIHNGRCISHKMCPKKRPE